jgi:hypothetical protein
MNLSKAELATLQKMKFPQLIELGATLGLRKARNKQLMLEAIINARSEG